MPSGNQIWYKTNDGVVIVPRDMSPTTNEYTDTTGVMTFADNVTSIAQSAFQSKVTLTEFYGGMSLATVGNYAFVYCSSLTSIDLPNCTTVGNNAFDGCTSLTSIDLPNCTTVGSSVFQSCTRLTTVTLGASTMCSLGNSNAFKNCSNLTSIYVTASLVDTYKENTRWSWFADKIVPIA